MADIVRVFGSSAAGKETFINFIVTNSSGEVAQRLWFSEKNIIPIQASIKNIWQFENDPIAKKRDDIIPEIRSLIDYENTICLLKWQDLDDLETWRVTQIQTIFPNVTHSIIFLHADIDILFERIKKKSRWKPEYTKEEITEWLEYQVEELEKLQNIKIISLDSSTNDYKEISFPPIQ